MKNKEVFEKNLNESAELKLENDLNLKTQMKGLAKTFTAGFLNEGKVFNQLKNLLYYVGGYPSENSPAKIESLTDDFCKVLIMLNLIDNNYITERMKSIYNIDVTIPEKEYTFEEESFAESYKDLVSEIDKAPNTPKEALQDLLKRALAIEGQMCANKDTIKEEKVPEVEENCSILKKNFMKAVSIKTKAMKKEDENPDVIKEEKEKIETDMDALHKVLEEMN